MEYWIWLTSLKGIGQVLQKRLLKHFKGPENIYRAKKEELIKVDGIGTLLGETIENSRSLDHSLHILDQAHKKSIKLLSFDDTSYPQYAKEFDQAPILLYYKGSIIKDPKGIAIVGSRRCSKYGKQIAIDAASYAAHNNIPVISGMAKGIDSYAHTACIKSGGYTIAFLGNGVDISYPKEHTELMEAIIESGAVISEYPPGTKARPEYFPKRNALISGWSEKILVVEAAEKSGALITADIARKQGKTLLVPPHEIYNPSARGTNKLIENGASLYLDPSQLLIKSDHIINDIGKTSKNDKIKSTKCPQKVKHNKLKPIETHIVEILRDSIKTIEEIAIEIKIDQVSLIQILSTMEIMGIIETLPGGRYSYL